MRLLTFFTTALVLTFLFSACGLIHSKSKSDVQKAVSAATPYPDGARRVTIAELEELLKENKAVVIDVRSQDSYDAGHIPGAINITVQDLEAKVNTIPKGKKIIAYCS